MNKQTLSPLRIRAELKAMSLQTLKRKTAELLQKAIRMESADKHGMIRCVTCGIRLPWNNANSSGLRAMHAGHFVASRCNSVLFDERNIHPQCDHCNGQLGGNPLEYEKWMQENYGPDVVDELKRNRHRTDISFDREELYCMREIYRARIARQQKRLETQ